MPGPDLPIDKNETETTAKVPEAAPLTSHMFVKRTEKSVFMAAWVDYAPGYKPDTLGEMNANRDNFIKGLCTLTSTQNIRLGMVPGIEFRCESKTTTFKARVYMLGSRPIMIVAGTTKGVDDSTNVETFFNSFEIKQ